MLDEKHTRPFITYVLLPAFALLEACSLLPVLNFWLMPMVGVLVVIDACVMYKVIYAPSHHKHDTVSLPSQEVPTSYSRKKQIIFAITLLFFAIQLSTMREIALSYVSLPGIMLIPVLALISLPRVLYVHQRIKATAEIEGVGKYAQSYMACLMALSALLFSSQLSIPAFIIALLLASLVAQNATNEDAHKLATGGTSISLFKTFIERFSRLKDKFMEIDFSLTAENFMNVAKFLDRSITHFALFIHIAAELILPYYVSTVLIGSGTYIQRLPFLLGGAFESGIEFCIDIPSFCRSEDKEQSGTPAVCQPGHKKTVSTAGQLLKELAIFIAAATRALLAYSSVKSMSTSLSKTIAWSAFAAAAIADKTAYSEQLGNDCRDGSHSHQFEYFQRAVGQCLKMKPSQ